MATRKKKNLGGRPTKLTQALQDEICEVIKQGNYIETAVACCGVSKPTFYAWAKKGARDQELKRNNIHTRFLNAVKKAMSEAEANDLTIITAVAGSGVWQAAAWKLERRNPTRWGRSERPPETLGEEEENLPDEFM